MARLLVSLSQPGNKGVFWDSLSHHQIIEVAGSELPGEPFDLALLDMTSFFQLRETLLSQRQTSGRSRPPVLILLRQAQLPKLQGLLGTEVDDVLILPSSHLELSARIGNMLQLQRPSPVPQTQSDPPENYCLRTDRAYQVLAAGNEAVLRAENEGQLFQSVLDTLVGLNDYALAWIGFAREDEQRNLEILACSGDIRDYLHELQVRWQDDRFSQGPGGRAVKTRRPVVCQDIETDQSFTPWRRQAREYGIRSVAAIPLVCSDDEVGLLSIYSTRARTFTEDEVSLLERLAANIAFGVDTLRMRYHLQEQRSLAWNSAYRDALTGLPNRQWVMEELSQLDAELARHHRVAAVLFIDLDGFKRINDSLGHEVGDQLLHAVAQRLSEVARTEDFVARLGGDEFLVLMRFDEADDLIANASDQCSAAADAAAQLAERVTEALRQPFQEGSFQHHLGASIGISLYPADTTRARDLVNCADIAMYEAKSSGSGHYRFYYKDLSLRNRQKLALKNNVHQAVDNNAFSAYYQPIIDLRTGQVVYIEALMRMMRPDGTVTKPGHFLQTLEETGLITRTGQALLEQAGQTLARCRYLFPDLRLSLNLSITQLWQADLIDQLELVLERHSLPHSALMLEVTEGAMLTDIVKTEQFLRALHDRGFEIAIDDFGTGYSSLSRLRSLPVNKLKVDKSFLDKVPQDRGSVEMIRAILQMARSLGLDVVAEGIETAPQLHTLVEAGCALGQGYLFSPPMAAGDLPVYLSQPVQGRQQMARPVI